MLQTLFYIPDQIAGVPVFGFGWALLVWAIVSVVLIAMLVRQQGWSGELLGYLPLLGLLGGVICFVLPNIVEPGLGLPIRGFGVMMLLAVVSGVGLCVYRAQQMGIDSEVIFSLAFWVFLLGIAGARLFYVIEYPQQFMKPTLVESLRAFADVPSGGIVLYGGFFGGVTASAWFFLSRKLPALAMADIVIPGMVIGASLGRVGCFLNGCCFGGLCEAQLPAVHFPAGSPPYKQQLEFGQLHGFTFRDADEAVVVSSVRPDSPAAEAGIKAGDEIEAINGELVANKLHARALLERSPENTRIRLRGESDARLLQPIPLRSLPVHPAQLYDAMSMALLCGTLWFYYPLRRRDGEVLALALLVYPVSRFVLEIIRVDEPSQFGTELSISQLISFGVLATGVAILIFVEIQRRPLALPWKGAEVAA